MGFSKLAVAAAIAVAISAPGQAVAQTAQASAQVSTSGSVSATSSGFFDNYSFRLGLQAAGPLLFRDVPDQRVQETTVFQYGPRMAFLFGHEVKDIHRAGLGVAYLPTAKSHSRSVAFLPIFLQYEIGHPLVLQAAAGANVTLGTAGFAGKYSGLHTGMALRYSFQALDKWSPITVSPGIAAQANVSTSAVQYSSMFLGAQIEIMYDSNN
jgi:hypothetical protein